MTSNTNRVALRNASYQWYAEDGQWVAYWAKAVRFETFFEAWAYIEAKGLTCKAVALV